MKYRTSKLTITILLLTASFSFLYSQKKVYGTITDCEKNPLPGVSIIVDTLTTISNMDGMYKIIVPDTSSFIYYTAIGMTPQKIRVGTQDTINISLKMRLQSEDSTKRVIKVKKPVIYLYPKSKTEISLKVAYNGKLLFSYPQYQEGWEVVATPNGNLFNKKDGRSYSYLFWEGEKIYKNNETAYQSGYVVHKDSIVTFLQDKLEQIGLQTHECNDFIVFWTPYLMQNEWNFIHFRLGKAYEIISRNSVTPLPETEIRVFMDFKGIDTPFHIAPQQIKAPLRTGFTLVEWGGAELKQPITVQIKSGDYLIR